MVLDEVLIALGSTGKFQLLCFLSISIFDNFLSIWHMTVQIYLDYEPEHWCRLPEEDIIIEYNTTPFINGDISYPKCHTYDYSNPANNTIPCRAWNYVKDPIKSSIVTEFDLVCDKRAYPQHASLVFNLGIMLGGFIFGYISDKKGRKIVLITCCVTQAILGILTAFATNLYLYNILRFCIGALEQGVNITGFVMAMELFPPKERSIFGMAHEFFWAIGGCILPLMAYFLRHWSHLQLAISIPGLFALVLILVPESLVWLLSNGHFKEAEKIVQKAAKLNGKSIPANCFSDLDERIKSHIDKPAHVNDATPLDLIKTPEMRKITFCLCGLWALNTMVYYGLSYNTANLHGDIYLNFAIGQAVEVPSVLVTMILIYKVGRRWPLCLFHVLGGVLCIASPFIPETNGNGTDIQWISTVLAILAKFAINSSFTILYIYGPEIYPTVLRNTGSAIASTAGRVGGIVYPYVILLSKMDIPNAKQMPLIVFGVISIIGGFLALPLPESRNKPLPETIDDIENYEEFCLKANLVFDGNDLSSNSNKYETTTMI